MTFDNDTFINNYGTDNAGVMRVFEMSVAIITNCIMINNTAKEKGGAYRMGERGFLTIINSVIDGSSANNGGIFDIYEGYFAEVTIINTIFRNCKAFMTALIEVYDARI